MPFCTHTWGSCSHGGLHRCDGYLQQGHVHSCTKCGKSGT